MLSRIERSMEVTYLVDPSVILDAIHVDARWWKLTSVLISVMDGRVHITVRPIDPREPPF